MHDPDHDHDETVRPITTSRELKRFLDSRGYRVLPGTWDLVTEGDPHPMRFTSRADLLAWVNQLRQRLYGHRPSRIRSLLRYVFSP